MNAGAISGLANSRYTSGPDAVPIPPLNMTAWAHEFTGTGDVQQMLPNITNERDGMEVYIRNSKTSGQVTLVPGGQGDTIGDVTSYALLPGESVSLRSAVAESRWIILNNEAAASPMTSPVQFNGEDVTEIVVVPPVQGRMKNGVLSLMIDPASMVQSDQAPGIYAALSQDVEVVGNAIHDSKVYCDELLVSGGAFLSLDEINKGLTLQDVTMDDLNITGGTAFLLVAHIAFDMVPSEDFQLTVRLWEHTQPEASADKIVEDINGRLLSKTVTVKAGEPIAPIILEGVCLFTGMATIGISVTHNAQSDGVMLAGRVRGGTCIMAQALTEKSHTGLAQLAYEADFNERILVEKKYFGPIANIAFSLSRNEAEQTAPARAGILTADGWELDNVTEVKAKISNKVLTVSDTGNLADFFLGHTLHEDDVYSLHGRSLRARVRLADPNDAFKLVALAGSDTVDAKKRIERRDNTAIVWAPGWTEISDSFIEEQPSGAYRTYVLDFVVPDASVVFNAPANSLPMVYRSVPIKWQVKAGEAYGLQMRSDAKDGAYIQTSGVAPVLRLDIKMI